MKKLIIALVLCLFMVGCGGSKKNCDYAAEIEYGKENVFLFGGSFYYLVRTPSQVLIIFKGNASNNKTTRTYDVTEFVKYKGDKL